MFECCGVMKFSIPDMTEKIMALQTSVKDGVTDGAIAKTAQWPVSASRCFANALIRADAGSGGR